MNSAIVIFVFAFVFVIGGVVESYSCVVNTSGGPRVNEELGARVTGLALIVGLPNWEVTFMVCGD